MSYRAEERLVRSHDECKRSIPIPYVEEVLGGNLLADCRPMGYTIPSPGQQTPRSEPIPRNNLVVLESPCRGVRNEISRRIRSSHCPRKGPVHYTAEGIVEKNRGRVGQMVLDLLDEGCSNALVGAGARSGRYR